MENKISPASSAEPHIVAILVDDEAGALKTLRGMLNAYCPQIVIGGTATSIKEAVEVAAAIDPDLVFLDIEIKPFGNGFDFLKQCSPFTFGVIFTTAHPQYAIDAIRLAQPWAYLVKPYSVRELRQAVQTAETKLSDSGQSPYQKARHQRLIVQDRRKGTLVIRVGHILYCEADGSFTDILIWKGGTIERITTSRKLGEYEEELPEVLFCRTHHSFLVNMAFVERFERTGRNGILHLSVPDQHVPVSVLKTDVIAERLAFLSFGG